VLVEDEYQLAMLRAERDWVRKLVRELESGELAWSYPELEELSKRTWAEARPQRERANHERTAGGGGAPVM
jgi:hypothetical protein